MCFLCCLHRSQCDHSQWTQCCAVSKPHSLTPYETRHSDRHLHPEVLAKIIVKVQATKLTYLIPEEPLKNLHRVCNGELKLLIRWQEKRLKKFFRHSLSITEVSSPANQNIIWLRCLQLKLGKAWRETRLGLNADCWVWSSSFRIFQMYTKFSFWWFHSIVIKCKWFASTGIILDFKKHDNHDQARPTEDTSDIGLPPAPFIIGSSGMEK